MAETASETAEKPQECFAGLKDLKNRLEQKNFGIFGFFECAQHENNPATVDYMIKTFDANAKKNIFRVAGYYEGTKQVVIEVGEIQKLYTIDNDKLFKKIAGILKDRGEGSQQNLENYQVKKSTNKKTNQNTTPSAEELAALKEAYEPLTAEQEKDLKEKFGIDEKWLAENPYWTKDSAYHVLHTVDLEDDSSIGQAVMKTLLKIYEKVGDPTHEFTFQYIPNLFLSNHFEDYIWGDSFMTKEREGFNQYPEYTPLEGDNMQKLEIFELSLIAKRDGGTIDEIHQILGFKNYETVKQGLENLIASKEK